jgi:hypothetical protein
MNEETVNKFLCGMEVTNINLYHEQGDLTGVHVFLDSRVIFAINWDNYGLKVDIHGPDQEEGGKCAE